MIQLPRNAYRLSVFSYISMLYKKSCCKWLPEYYSVSAKVKHNLHNFAGGHVTAFSSTFSSQKLDFSEWEIKKEKVPLCQNRWRYVEYMKQDIFTCV